jgi:Carboxypeptidase regulatory-like domain
LCRVCDCRVSISPQYSSRWLVKCSILLPLTVVNIHPVSAQTYDPIRDFGITAIVATLLALRIARFLRYTPEFLSLLLLIGGLIVCPARMEAQGESTSAIVGQVTDATNAAIPGATVRVTNRGTGLERSAKTDQEGRFNFPQLRPGSYTVRVEADGFEPQQNDNIPSGLGQKQEVNFKLNVAHSEQRVQVSSEAPLMNPANTNTSSSLSGAVLADLPNPGADLTYPLQFASGALINTRATAVMPSRVRMVTATWSSTDCPPRRMATSSMALKPTTRSPI